MNCLIPKCNNFVHARGWCQRHYDLWKLRGDPNAEPLATKRGAALQWIYDHASFIGDECLLWPFAKSPNGYGSLKFKRRNIVASRFMCALVHGEAPSKYHDAAHSCGNGASACMTPKHLRWATRSENHADKILHGTTNRGERHPRAKLTERDVLEIVRRLDRGDEQQAIAKTFGVHKVMISRINLGKAWIWLTKRDASFARQRPYQ